MAIRKKIKKESLLDKKIREIKEAIDLFNLDIVDYEVLYPSLKNWEQYIKTISRYLLISPNSVLLTILSI